MCTQLEKIKNDVSLKQRTPKRFVTLFQVFISRHVHTTVRREQQNVLF